MNICYICSRYADPDVRNRRRNLAESRALARWAEAQGYAVVTWWGSLEPDDPPCDGDEAVRAAALARSRTLAEMVGDAGGDIVIGDWYQMTAGMYADYRALSRCLNARDVLPVSWAEVGPYYRAQVDTVPRASVQAAVDEMHAEAARRDVRTHGYGCNDDLIYALEVLRDKCGITPTEVQS